jgi:hypothetical protein
MFASFLSDYLLYYSRSSVSKARQQQRAQRQAQVQQRPQRQWQQVQAQHQVRQQARQPQQGNRRQRARVPLAAPAAKPNRRLPMPTDAALLAQNRQAAKERIRGDIEYEVNLKAELEIAHLHEKLDRLHGEVLGRLDELQRLVKTPVDPLARRS